MDVQISISETSVTLGNPVTITYSAEDCADVTLTVDNFPNPIDLGGGESISGTIKLLPLTDGQFNVVITGSGRFGRSNDYMPEITKQVSCQVN
jgi:hypothetical protein